MEIFTFNISYHEYFDSPRSGFELQNFGTPPARISVRSPIMLWFLIFRGHAVTQLVETLRYKPSGRGFHSGW
jgi:hypothetical protein